ncbi:hypothetical protein HBI56_129840 [Parastagonospora nodorum]|uniref:Uncharacterized protein n=1 Tax=Phaeosphaeria nodorum (strain SN15 / ATCC MYA-4574 / FGSC 10173) TaxID=321614 RepID=A0A7U2HZ37_PHANO|nr:hypothetical protein HBH56_153970 [Parastagonospora nodorum]QRC95968.1 hypothetical protein JI435_408110 [Parastagonospora nodorum SN15]KAH3926577.1 hypothetical protein HBH54_163710 [Parastagonospora nodorum]KAH3943283.1 hypothetical protein HBH53_175490 [Parastagonospora nodorum]KAH3970198.1 hypothetical protein HBH52_167180 [Parastagonospora nodorum]
MRPYFGQTGGGKRLFHGEAGQSVSIHASRHVAHCGMGNDRLGLGSPRAVRGLASGSLHMHWTLGGVAINHSYRSLP